MSRQGIVCGGAWYVDRNKLIDRWPEQEALATILSEERQGGGNGANMSVDLKKLGAQFPGFFLDTGHEQRSSERSLDAPLQKGHDPPLLCSKSPRAPPA